MTDTQIKKLGRPPEPFDEDKAIEFLDRYANGERLSLLCEGEDKIISRRVLNRWLMEYPDFRTLHSRAREQRADNLAESVQDIADTELDAQKARNRIDARKWLASVMKPREYGNKIDLNVTQAPSLREALEAAKLRTLRPISDQLTHQQSQVIDITAETIVKTSDSQSPDPVPLADQSLLDD